MSRIMVLNDGETYTAIRGCQIVEVPDAATDDDIDIYLDILNRDHNDCANADIIGGFDEDGNFLVGDPRTMDPKKVIKLE